MAVRHRRLRRVGALLSCTLTICGLVALNGASPSFAGYSWGIFQGESLTAVGQTTVLPVTTSTPASGNGRAMDLPFGGTLAKWGYTTPSSKPVGTQHLVVRLIARAEPCHNPADNSTWPKVAVAMNGEPLEALSTGVVQRNRVVASRGWVFYLYRTSSVVPLNVQRGFTVEYPNFHMQGSCRRVLTVDSLSVTWDRQLPSGKLASQQALAVGGWDPIDESVTGNGTIGSGSATISSMNSWGSLGW